MFTFQSITQPVKIIKAAARTRRALFCLTISALAQGVNKAQFRRGAKSSSDSALYGSLSAGFFSSSLDDGRSKILWTGFIRAYAAAKEAADRKLEMLKEFWTHHDQSRDQLHHADSSIQDVLKSAASGDGITDHWQVIESFL